MSPSLLGSRSALCVILVMALLAMSPARADRLDVVLNGKSYHFNTNAELNENNWGMGLEYEFQPKSPWIRYAVGNGFRDSMGEMSYMAGGGIKRRFPLDSLLNHLSFDVGITGFLMVRDDVNAGNPFPGVLPGITLGTPDWAVNLTYFPTRLAQEMNNARRYANSSDGVLFLQLKINARNFMPTLD